jgi:hypothetical protein
MFADNKTLNYTVTRRSHRLYAYTRRWATPDLERVPDEKFLGCD